MATRMANVTLKTLTLAALVLPLVTGCETMMPGNSRMEADVLDIKNKVNESLERQAATERSLSSQINAISENMDKMTNLSSTSLDELRNRVTAQTEEMNKLRGEVEALNATLKERAAPPTNSYNPGAMTPSPLDPNTGGLPPETGAGTTPPPTQGMTPDQLQAQATGLFNSGQFAQAKEVFNQALAQNPTGDLAFDINYGLAETCMKLNDSDGAVMAYNNAIRASNKYPRAWVALEKVSDIYLAKGEKAEAARRLQYIIDKRPQYPDIERVRAKLAQTR